jgi:hypothetical protein
VGKYVGTFPPVERIPALVGLYVGIGTSIDMDSSAPNSVYGFPSVNSVGAVETIDMDMSREVVSHTSSNRQSSANSASQHSTTSS